MAPPQGNQRVATLRNARNAYLSHQSPARRPVWQSSPCACARARARAPRRAPRRDPTRRAPPHPPAAHCCHADALRGDGRCAAMLSLSTMGQRPQKPLRSGRAAGHEA